MNHLHHCHCGFKEHFAKFKGRKLGALGVLLIGLHILWHVAECLVLPAVFVAFSHNHGENQVSANEPTQIITSAEELVPFLPYCGQPITVSNQATWFYLPDSPGKIHATFE